MRFTVTTYFQDKIAKKQKDVFVALSFEYDEAKNAVVFSEIQRMVREDVVKDGLFTVTKWMPAPELNEWADAWLVERKDKILLEIVEDLVKSPKPKIKIKKSVDVLSIFDRIRAIVGMTLLAVLLIGALTYR
jgi:hypothetical protein